LPIAYDIIVEGLKMSAVKSLGCSEASYRGSSNTKIFIWLLALTFLAFILRTLRLDFQPLWWDEGWSVYFATADVPTMIARTAIDIHPPLYYLALRLWILIIGSSAAAVRHFSVLAGTLSVPLIFLIGRRLFDVRVGIMASLTMTLAPFHIYYSQEARMYALVAFLVLASIYLFLSLLEGEEAASPVQWLFYIVITSLAMYTQYYAVFIPVSQTVFVLVGLRRNRGFLVRWLGAQFVLVLAYLPWVLYSGGKLVAYVSTKMVKEGDLPVGLRTYITEHLLAFSTGHLSEGRAFLSWIALVFIALIVLGIVGYVRHSSQHDFGTWRPTRAVAFTLIYLLLPLSLGYLVNLRYPFTSPGIQRLFLLSAPAFYLLVALGLSWLWQRLHLWWPVCLLLVVVSAPSLVDFYGGEHHAGDDYRPLIETVQALARTDDVIVAVHPWQIGYFHAYYDGQLPRLYLTPKEPTDVTSEEWATDPTLMAWELDSLLHEHRFLWFPAHQALGRILESDAEGYLSQRHYPILSQWFTDSTRLSCYAGAEELDPGAEQINFGDKVSLVAHGMTSGPVEASWGAVLMDLRWRVDAELDGKYQIALRLTDEEGQVWASQDSEPVGRLRSFHEQPVGSELSDHHGLLIPAGTPPGTYQLRLGLYRLRDGRWLEILDREGAPQRVEVALGTVEVLAPSPSPPKEALFIQHPRQADFAPGIRFLGYSVRGETFQPGDAVEMTLFWQAMADLEEDYHASVRLHDSGGQTRVAIEGPLTKSDYPASVWGEGQLFRGFLSLLLPAGLTSGHYDLSLSLYRPTDGGLLPLRRWGLDWGDSYLLGTIEVRGRAHEVEPPPSIGHPMSVRLGEVVQFLGYDLDRQEVSAGDSLHLTLYWQALSEMGKSYTVFNHLIDTENHIWGQMDGIPGGGSLPTSSWIAGEYVIDEYEILVREGAPPGEYLIETGMYDLATMVRLSVFDAHGAGMGDRILLEATPIYVGP